MMITARGLLMCVILITSKVKIFVTDSGPALLVTYISNMNTSSNMNKSYCRFPITENGIPMSNARCTNFNINVYFVSVCADYRLDVLFLYEYIRNIIYLERNHSREDIRTWTPLQTGPSSIFTRIAFDWLSHSLYWTDPTYGWVGVMNTKSNNTYMYGILHHENIQRPHGITLDPLQGVLFWTDIGPTVKIGSSSLSGDDQKVLISSGLMMPYSIVADVREEKIFWIDDGRDTIESALYDGTGRKLIRRLSHATPLDIDIFQEYVYVSDGQNQLVHVMDKDNGVTNKTIKIAGHTPYGIFMYHPEAQPLTSSDYCATLKCSHICVSRKNGATCMCKDGFKLDTDGRNCLDNSGLFHRGLVMSTSTSVCITEIHAIFINGYSPTCFLQTTGITHFQLDISRRELIFANSTGLYYTSVDRFSVHHLITVSGTISGLGLDWIDKSIYWTEVDTGVISYVSGDRGISLTILSGLNLPRNLLIVPLERRMFWVSGRYLHKIESSNLDGSDKRDVIQFSSLLKPSSISFDPSKKRLYFVDIIHITSCDLDGSNIKKHSTVPSSTVSVFVYKASLLLLYQLSPYPESIIKSFTIENFDLIEKASKKFLSMGRITDMNVFDSTLQPRMKGPCDELNGGCEQICISTSLVNKVCRCRFGYQSDTHNGNMCSSAPVYSNFILVSDWTHGVIYQLSLDHNTVQAVDIKKMTNPSGIAYDHVRKTVIWGSSSEQQIFSVGINGSAESFLFATGDSYSTYPDRFAIDFSTGNIYYTAVGVNELVNPRGGYIAVLSVDALHKRLIIGLEKPRAIVLHPSEGLMFWTDHGSYPHIGRAAMDGRNRISLITTGVKWPNGLTIDYSGGRLYWSDGYTDRIESCKLDGSNRKLIFVDSGAHLMDIAFEKSGSLYYTAWNRPYITKLVLPQPNQTVHLFENPEFGRLDALEIYTADSQPRNALCLLYNGNCSTFCLPTIYGRNCSCEDGVSMSKDGKTCSNVAQVSSTARSSSVTTSTATSATSTAKTSTPSSKTTFSISSITTKSAFTSTTTSSAISKIRSASLSSASTMSLPTSITTLSLPTSSTTSFLPTSTNKEVVDSINIVMPSATITTMNLATTDITSVSSAASTTITSLSTITIENSLLTSTTITSLPAVTDRMSPPNSISKTSLLSSTTTMSLPTSSTTSSLLANTTTISSPTSSTVSSFATSTTTSSLLTNTTTMSPPTSTTTSSLLTNSTTMSSPNRFATSSTTRQTKTTTNQGRTESMSTSSLITSSKRDIYTKHDATKGNNNQTHILIAAGSLAGIFMLIVVTVLVIWCIRKRKSLKQGRSQGSSYSDEHIALHNAEIPSNIRVATNSDRRLIFSEHDA